MCYHNLHVNAWKTWIVAQTLGSNTAATLWTSMEIRSSIHNSSRQMQTNITCHRQYHDIYSITPTLYCVGRNVFWPPYSWWWFDKPISRHLHVADAVQKGFRKVYMCTVNTDVMVLVIAAFELWIVFGTGSFIIMIPQIEFVLLESRLPCYHRLWYHIIINFAGRGKHCKNWSVLCTHQQCT